MKKNIVIGFVAIAAFAAAMSSLIVWHQSETPSCIA